jgi:hypothetical protein
MTGVGLGAAVVVPVTGSDTLVLWITCEMEPTARVKEVYVDPLYCPELTGVNNKNGRCVTNVSCASSNAAERCSGHGSPLPNVFRVPHGYLR